MKLMNYIDKGWFVKQIVAQHIATGSDYQLQGGFCFLLEKQL